MGVYKGMPHIYTCRQNAWQNACKFESQIRACAGVRCIRMCYLTRDKTTARRLLLQHSCVLVIDYYYLTRDNIQHSYTISHWYLSHDKVKMVALANGGSINMRYAKCAIIRKQLSMCSYVFRFCEIFCSLVMCICILMSIEKY